ncbi:hypothetical protein Tco_0497870 [Tanacetum coccineum]
MAWRTGAPKDGMPPVDSYSALDVKTGTRPRAAHEVPLLTITANRVIDMEDITGTSESSRTPSTVEKSLLDFAERLPAITERDREPND